MTSRKNRGFSLLEMVMVIAIGLILAGCAFVAMVPVWKENHVDQGYDTVLSTFRNYRNQAITQGKRYVLTFSPANTTPATITAAYWGYVAPPGTSPAPVTLYTYQLPTDMQFAVVSGSFPNPGPDNFGTGAAAVYFNACAVIESGNPCVVFYPDGSAQDDAGNYNYGVLYMMRTDGALYSARAVDVYGTTGRVRGWRLYNVSGTNTWEQQ
jgi:prepilin-type N-terminal cleavage/methylation domain-containing protein